MRDTGSVLEEDDPAEQGKWGDRDMTGSGEDVEPSGNRINNHDASKPPREEIGDDNQMSDR